MVFSSMVFLWGFLPAVFLINLILPKRLSNIFLLLASLAFYAWGEPVMVLLMVVSILVNWLVGIGIERNEKQKKLWLILGIMFNLLALGYYKYAGFLATLINDIVRRDLLTIKEIALPIGISFFTFQAMSYIIDVYRKETEASISPINVALYISFFPQLIAGPIVRYHDINEQIICRTISMDKFIWGFRRFIYGLSKKVLIANVLGECADTLFGYGPEAMNGVMAWIALFVYNFQIYYDFSGYSDMAIGLGKMFGFDIQENFNYPYLSKSVSEYWRRWHISLGQWFREYVYIPLGGNRKGTGRTYLNLLLVFFLTGLWHGANYTYVIWGLWHGIFSILERLGLEKYLQKSRVLSRVYMAVVLDFGWVLFRNDNIQNSMIHFKHILTPWLYRENTTSIWEYLDMKVIIIFVLALLGSGIVQALVSEKWKARWRGSVLETVFCGGMLLLCIAAIAGDTYNPFIYFQF